MKFERYWQRFLKKNPKATSSVKVTITAERFRHCMSHAYSQGYRDGKESAEQEKSLFERIFG